MTDQSPPTDPPSRLGRLLYSGILAYMAVDGFRNNEKRVDVARSQGVPLPELAVPAATALLLVCNLGVLFWKYPRASLAGLVTFFLTTTPSIHSFWEMEGKDRQHNKINFLKNVALLGGAIILLHEANEQAGE